MYSPKKPGDVYMQLRTLLPEGKMLRVHRLPPQERRAAGMPFPPGNRANIRSICRSLHEKFPEVISPDTRRPHSYSALQLVRTARTVETIVRSGKGDPFR